MAPSVTFLVMSHNYGHWLGECLESIAQQTRLDFEVLVINAGSTDDTSEVARHFPGVELIEIEDEGLSSSRNAGLERAVGNWIVNLDADDKIHPRFLDRVLAKAGPQTIVCPGMQEFGDSSNSGWPNSLWGPEWGLSYPHFCQGNRIFCCSMFPRRMAWLVGGYDPALDWLGMEDWCLWTDMVKRGCSVEIVPELLFYHRTHPTSNAQRWKGERHAQARSYIRAKHPLVRVANETH